VGLGGAARRAAPGAHRVVRSDAQRAGLERVVLAAAAGQAGRPCHRKPHRPPGEQAKVEADRLRERLAGHHDDVVIDLAAYTRLVDSADDEHAEGGEA
jgi:hypothetical protein